jgi:uncharacterized protein
MRKRFEFETVIKDKANICNMIEDKNRILELILDGKKVLFYGRRNTGKTSLIEACIIPEWLKTNRSGLTVFIDFYGVRTISHISERIALGFSEAFSRTSKTKRLIQSTFQLIASLRPKLSLDDTGKPQIELGISNESSPHFKEIFSKLNEIHQKRIPILIVMDEFQDIVGIDEAEGLLRNSLQGLMSTIPVIILGSKKHMLSKIFSNPEKPFYNWGEPVDVSPIDYDEYTDFMKARGLNIVSEASQYLQDKMKRIPEPINITCYHLVKKYGKRKITSPIIDKIIEEIVYTRRGRPQEYLSTLTANQARLLAVISKLGSVNKITAKSIQQSANLSSPGILKIVAYLEDHGIIHKSEVGYEITDPFLELHLKKYGI